jgi:hypothetical protein
MDDLIILLIRAIARALSGPKQPAPRQPTAPSNPNAVPNLPPAWQEQVRQAMAAGQRPAKTKSRGRRPAPPPMPAAPVPVTIVQEISAAAPAAHASTRQAPHAARADLRHWLTPAVLQRQFILTEVLQPPLALREPR